MPRFLRNPAGLSARAANFLGQPVLVLLCIGLLDETRAATGFMADADVLVKTSASFTISVALSKDVPDPTQGFSAYSLTLVASSPFTGWTNWSSSGDPLLRTSSIVTPTGVGLSPRYPGGGAPPVAVYKVQANSLKDLGTYTYSFSGTVGSWDGANLTLQHPGQSDSFDIVIFNHPPTATPQVTSLINSVSLTQLSVGTTVQLRANASDPDHPGTNLPHYQWSISATHPTGSLMTIKGDTSATPIITPGKQDIGPWVLNLEVADAEGELKTFTLGFEVKNRPPSLIIDGPHTVNAPDHLHLVAGPDQDDDLENISWTWNLVASPSTAAQQPTSNYKTGKTIDFATTATDTGTWTFKCTATDEHNLSVSDTYTVTVAPTPPKIALEGAKQIKVGEMISFETTELNDGYGQPLKSFGWDIVQVPVPAGQGLTSGFSTSSTIMIPTGPNSAGTWRFKLTVTDNQGLTAEATAKVLVDAPPVAIITGPDQTGNALVALQLSGSNSTDPDTDVAYLSDSSPDISMGIVEYQWSIREVPPALYGQYFPGPAPDVLGGIPGVTASLNIPAGTLPVGDWLFELKVIDAEGSVGTQTHWVSVLDENVPPIAIVSPPGAYAVGLDGKVTVDIAVDGAGSFDPDNLIVSPMAPGLGIRDYHWDLTAPASSLHFPAIPSGASASTATLFTAGTVVAASDQGTYTVSLTVTDDDSPSPRKATASTTMLIGDCGGALCIDYPTSTQPQFVRFSNQTDVVIYYHLGAQVYRDGIFDNGLRLLTEIYVEGEPLLPVFRTWDVDMLPSGGGLVAAVHWPGFVNRTNRPKPGKYSIFAHLVDSSGNFTSYADSAPDSIWIQVIEVSIGSETSVQLDADGLKERSDQLKVKYQVNGQLPEDPGFDELLWRIYPTGGTTVVASGSLAAPFDGTFSWNGDVGVSTTISPGEYQLELEIRSQGASLSISPRHDFLVYRVRIDGNLFATTNPFNFAPNGDKVADLVEDKGLYLTTGSSGQVEFSCDPMTVEPASIAARINWGVARLATPKAVEGFGMFVAMGTDAWVKFGFVPLERDSDPTSPRVPVWGFDDNSDGILEPSEARPVRLANSQVIFGLSDAKYVAAVAFLQGKFASWAQIPVAQSLLNSFLNGIAPPAATVSSISLHYSGQTHKALEDKVNKLQDSWAHGAGADFDSAGNAVLKLYVFPKTSDAAEKVTVGAPAKLDNNVTALVTQPLDATNPKKGRFRAALLKAAGTNPVSGSFSVSYINVDFDYTTAIVNPLANDDATDLGLALGSCKGEFTCQATYTQIGTTGKYDVTVVVDGKIYDLYDFQYGKLNFLVDFNTEGATVELGYDKTRPERQAGRVFVTEIDFTKTYHFTLP